MKGELKRKIADYLKIKEYRNMYLIHKSIRTNADTGDYESLGEKTYPIWIEMHYSKESSLTFGLKNRCETKEDEEKIRAWSGHLDEDSFYVSFLINDYGPRSSNDYFLNLFKDFEKFLDDVDGGCGSDVNYSYEFSNEAFFKFLDLIDENDWTISETLIL